MSVLGGILLFTAGIGVGGGAVIFNRACVQRETEKLRRENERLKAEAAKAALDLEADRAYRCGYRDGRKSPMNAVQELADTLEQHNARLKVRRE